MESLELLELIYSDALEYNEFEEDIEEVKREYNIIKQDLERLEIIEENYYSLNKAFEEIEFENVRLKDKENPMKPIWKGTNSQGATFYYSYCPKCNTQVSKYTNKYCPYCGQKIDWSEE